MRILVTDGMDKSAVRFGCAFSHIILLFHFNHFGGADHAFQIADAAVVAVLFSLGCYSGEPITVIARRRGGYVVSIKDGRYNIDEQLAEAIIVSE